MLETKLSDTLVKRVYEKIADTIIEEKGSYYVIFSRFLPLLLSEVDALKVIYPEAGEVLYNIYIKLWNSRFPDIPPPEIDPIASGRDIQEKTYEALYKYRDRLLGDMDNKYKPINEIEGEIQRETVLFMDRLLRTFFKLYKLLG